MNNFLKMAVVTGVVSAGVYVGGSVSHAANFGSESSLNGQNQLSLSSPSVNLNLGVDSNSHTNVSVDKTKSDVKADVQAKGTVKASVTKADVKAEGTAKTSASKTDVKGESNTSVNGHGDLKADTTAKVADQLQTSVNKKLESNTLNGYYISLDGKTSRMTADVDSHLNTKTYTVVNEKAATKPSITVNLGTKKVKADADVKAKAKAKADVSTTVSETSKTAASNQVDQNNAYVGDNASSSSQLDLLTDLSLGFNLDNK